MPLPKSISLNVRSLYYITAIRWERAEVVEKTSREREAVNSCCLHTQRGCVRAGNGAHIFAFVEGLLLRRSSWYTGQATGMI
jgi:hypothetical protein